MTTDDRDETEDPTADSCEGLDKFENSVAAAIDAAEEIPDPLVH